jgi:hypothetical protein
MQSHDFFHKSDICKKYQGQLSISTKYANTHLFQSLMHTFINTIMHLNQRFFFGREIAKKRDNLQMYKCDPLYYTVSKLQDRSNAPKFSDDIASLWMNVPILDE